MTFQSETPATFDGQPGSENLTFPNEIPHNSTPLVSGQAYTDEAMKLIMGRAVFPFYQSYEHTSPVKKMSLSDMVQMIQYPQIGPKDKTLPALTPFDAEAKTKEIARTSLYHALLIDHDHDNKDNTEIRAIYDPYDMAYIAWTTSSHQQPGKGNRWKVLIPFDAPIGFDLWREIAVGSVLMIGSDPAQARPQQIFFAPNKLSDDAPYDFIIYLDRPFLDPADPFRPFVNQCLHAYTDHEARKTRQAEAAPIKPRQLNGFDGSIIEKINAAFQMGDVLTNDGYVFKKKKYLYPGSESGVPGVTILNRDGKEVVYSHHGPADPLSHHNHQGHALDVFDVLCTLRYGSDVGRAVRELAPQVDPDGQKQRQREYMEKKAAEKSGNADQQAQTPDPDFDMTNFSMSGSSAFMEAKMQDDKYILGRLAIAGQSTVIYAPPNAGKTLICCHLIVQGIKNGTIRGDNIFYINADDTYKGLVFKLRIAEKFGFHQLAPGHGKPGGPLFKAEEVPTYLSKIIKNEKATETIFIFDTVKKFTDLMSKEKSTRFMETIRQFISHGGTVIMLAHVNKHRDENKKVVYAGTADLVDDADCAYTLDIVQDANNGIRTVKFENFKARGDVATEAFYSYRFTNDATWFEKLESVTAIDENERQQVEAERLMADRLRKNQIAVDAIIDCIREGVTKKTDLIKEAAERSGISKTKITKALIDHTGPDVSKNQFWFVERKENNAKTYQLNYGVVS